MAGLREVVQAALPWDSFVHDLANVDAAGRVRYQTFLARYRVESSDTAWQGRVLASLYAKLCEKDLSGTLAFFDTNLDGQVTTVELTQASSRSARSWPLALPAPYGHRPAAYGPQPASHSPQPASHGPARAWPGRCSRSAASGYRRSSPRASPHSCYRARPRSRRRSCSTTSKSSSRNLPSPSRGHGRRLRGRRRCSTRRAAPPSCPRLATIAPSLSPRDFSSVAPPLNTQTHKHTCVRAYTPSAADLLPQHHAPRALLQVSKQCAARKSSSLDLFRSFDKNGDGFISFGEFEQLALARTPALTPTLTPALTPTL